MPKFKTKDVTPVRHCKNLAIPLKEDSRFHLRTSNRRKS